MSAQLSSGTATVTRACRNAKQTPLHRNLYISSVKLVKSRRQGRRLGRHHGQYTTSASMGPSMPPAAFPWLHCLPWRHHSTRRTQHFKSRKQRCGYSGQGLGLSPELHTAIDKFIQDNKIVLFMKGNRMFPQCGFSNTCVQVHCVM